jgi:hypothetical protein
VPQRLQSDDIERAAQTIGCDVAALQAVIEVECGQGGGFFADGRPKMCFEPHYMWKLLRDKPSLQEAAQAAGVAHPDWDPHDYPAGADAMYARLGKAQDIDEDAALQACSWGIGQVMGIYWSASGYASIQDMVASMAESEGAQLDLMVGFIQRNGLGPYLAAHDWAGFARRYNGPGYAANRYDTKLAAAYERHSN